VSSYQFCWRYLYISFFLPFLFVFSTVLPTLVHEYSLAKLSFFLFLSFWALGLWGFGVAMDLGFQWVPVGIRKAQGKDGGGRRPPTIISPNDGMNFSGISRRVL